MAEPQPELRAFVVDQIRELDPTVALAGWELTADGASAGAAVTVARPAYATEVWKRALTRARVSAAAFTIRAPSRRSPWPRCRAPSARSLTNSRWRAKIRRSLRSTRHRTAARASTLNGLSR